MIPFKKVNLGNALEAVKPLIENGMIGLGNTVFEFEKALAKYVGCKYVVAVDSCTSALFLCLKQEKSAIIGIPSMTVPLVADAIVEAGKKIVFNDQTDWVGSAYKLTYTNIWDSAHQLEKNQFKKMKLDGKDKLCFSFYPTKNIGSADGGAIATNDKEFADWARKVSTYGRNQTGKYQNSWEYDVDLIGYKRHYTNLQAAICLEQLNRLDETNVRRIKIRDAYNKAFGYKNKSLYLYRLNVEDRNEFLKYMTEKGIMCGVHFQPLHMMNAFKDIFWEIESSQEKVEEAYEHTVSLPFFDTMTSGEIDYIIKAVLSSPIKIIK